MLCNPMVCPIHVFRHDQGADDWKSRLNIFLQQRDRPSANQLVARYTSTRSGLPHAPTFLAMVTVGGVSFEGHERPNKKDSERTAAYVALGSLRLDANALMRDPGARPAWEFQGGAPTPAAVTDTVAAARAGAVVDMPSSSSEDYSTAEDDVEDASAVEATPAADSAEDAPARDAAAGVAAAVAPVAADVPTFTSEDATVAADSTDDVTAAADGTRVGTRTEDDVEDAEDDVEDASAVEATPAADSAEDAPARDAAAGVAAAVAPVAADVPASTSEDATAAVDSTDDATASVRMR